MDAEKSRPAQAPARAAPCRGKRTADEVDDSDDCSRRTLFWEQARQHGEHLDRLAQLACDAAHWRRLYQEEKRLRSATEHRLENAENELSALRKDRLRKSARTAL